VPRLSNKQYLNQRVFLAKTRREVPGAFSSLTYAQQRDIHDYFQPNENWTEEEVLEHRVVVSRAQPSLPQRAGKHFRQVTVEVELPTQPITARAEPTTTTPSTGITVRGLARPAPDSRLIAHALLDFAKHLDNDRKSGGSR
jgi:hypothetical protein